MKSLKKLAAVAAVMSAMGFAKAEQKEVQFAPTNYEGGEIDKIELVNGHVLVRSNGKLNGFEMPYAYTSANIQDYATSAFAQGGATNVTQYVHAGNGKIYMTFDGVDGIYTTQIGKKFGPGVVEVDVKDPKTQKITKYAIRKIADSEKAAAEAALNGTAESAMTAVLGEDVYTLAANKKAIIKNGDAVNSSYFFGGTGLENATPESMVVLNTNDETLPVMPYILAKDTDGVKKIFTPDNVGKINRTPADSISVSDGSLVIKSGTEITVYNPQNGKSAVISSSNNGLPADVKSVAVSGNNIYYATAKKLGVKTID